MLLGGDRLLRGQDALDLAQVDEDQPGVLSLLDDAGDEVADLALEVAVGDVVLGLAKALDEHLARGR